MLENILKDLERTFKSDNAEARLSSVGLLANCMFSQDPEEKARAIKVMSNILDVPDMAVVHKAASALTEVGPIGWRYMEMAAMNPELSEAAKAAILVRQKMAQSENIDKKIYSKEEFDELARELIQQAYEETRYHKFSSVYMKRVAGDSDQPIRFVFDINTFRPEDYQFLLSVTYGEGKGKVSDSEYPYIVNTFCKNQEYKEHLDVSPNPDLRYFGWEFSPANHAAPG